MHYPAQPWCEVCVRAKASDAARPKQQRKDALIPLIQFDYGEAGEAGEGNFDFVVGSDLGTGSIWSSAVLKGGSDPYVVASAVSWLAELGHAKVQLQAGVHERSLS